MGCVGAEYFGAGFDGEDLGQRAIGFLKAEPAEWSAVYVAA